MVKIKSFEKLLFKSIYDRMKIKMKLELFFKKTKHYKPVYNTTPFDISPSDPFIKKSEHINQLNNILCKMNQEGVDVLMEESKIKEKLYDIDEGEIELSIFNIENSNSLFLEGKIEYRDENENLEEIYEIVHSKESELIKDGVLTNEGNILIAANFYRLKEFAEYRSPIIDHFFPEIKMVIGKYLKYMKFYEVNVTSWQSLEHVIRLLKENIQFLKQDLENQEINKNINYIAEEILRIRLIYVSDLFKLLNMRKIYILGYITQCLSSFIEFKKMGLEGYSATNETYIYKKLLFLPGYEMSDYVFKCIDLNVERGLEEWATNIRSHLLQ